MGHSECSPEREVHSDTGLTKKHTNISKSMGHSEGSPEREVHSDTELPKNDRNISDKQPNLTSTRTGGTTTNKAHSE